MSVNDPETMRQRSQAVWNGMAPGWDQRRVELWEDSRAVAEGLIRRLDPKVGDTVLEVAAGLGETGFLAVPLLGEQGQLITTDFAPDMVAAARRRAHEMGIGNVTFQVLDAERMALESNSVDGVLCRWGYMLMVDPAAAFAETRRVLRPGGRLAFSVFAAPEDNPWVSVLGRVLVTHGHLPAPHPTAPGIFALANPERIRELVTMVGFAEPEIEAVTWRWRFKDQAAYWSFMLEAAGAISPVLRALSSDEQAAIQAHVYEATQAFHTDNGYDFPAVVWNVVTQ